MAVLKNYDSNESEWEPLIVGKEGTGIPFGGATGQILSKTSGSDYATAWTNGISKGTSAAPLIPVGSYFDGTGLQMYAVGGNYALTPNAAPLQITGDLEIVARVKANDWTPPAFRIMAARHENEVASDAYVFAINTSSNGRLFLQWSTGAASISQTSTTGVPFSDGDTGWVKATLDVDNGAGGYSLNFYTAADSTTEPAVWTQLGATVVGASTTSINAGTRNLAIGNRPSSTSLPFDGTIYRVIIRNGIDGTVAFDADFSTVPADSLAFTESSANAATVTLTTGRYFYGLPNHQWSSIANYDLGANVIYYHPFVITEPITIDKVRFNIGTSSASNRNVRCGIYASDKNFQPVGAPLSDPGDVLVLANQTGIFIISITPVTLQPGPYLNAILCSAGTRFSGWRAGVVPLDVIGVELDTAISTNVDRTYGAMPNPGIQWTRRTISSGAGIHPVLFRWYPAT